jgi:hypothetical protein
VPQEAVWSSVADQLAAFGILDVVVRGRRVVVTCERPIALDGLEAMTSGIRGIAVISPFCLHILAEPSLAAEIGASWRGMPSDR